MTSPQTRIAKNSPEWLAHSVMYQIFLRAFTPEGTLKAAQAKLPELAELGVDILYLCPICLQDDDLRREFWSPRQNQFDFATNPYRIKDFYAIDPEYGNAADLHDFVTAAHGYGMRVILDIVFLHCGPAAIFIADHPDFVKRHPDGSIAYAAWNFPALNLDSPELREYLWRNLEYWLREFAVDGYRCDVSSGIPLDFWESARDRLERLKPDLIMLAEGERREDQLRAFDLNYNFTFAFGIHKLFNRGLPAGSVRQIWEKQHAEFPVGSRFIRYIDNHDIAHDSSTGQPGAQGRQDWDGWVPEGGLPPDSRLDRAWGHPAVDAVLAFNFALDGVPMLYNGQEVADSARHNIYTRWPVAWATGETPAGRARRALCRRLIELRHRESALSAGTLTWLDHGAPEALLAFLRQTGDQRLLFLVNLTRHPVKTTLAGIAGAFAPLVASGVSLSGPEVVCEPCGYFLGKA